MVKERLYEMISRNQIFKNNDVIKVINAQICFNGKTKTISTGITKIRNFYKNRKIEELEISEENVSSFLQNTDDNSFEFSLFAENIVSGIINETIKKDFISLHFVEMTSLNIYAESVTHNKKFLLSGTENAKTTYSFGKENIYEFSDNLEIIYVTIVGAGSEDVCRVIVHTKKYTDNNIFALYSDNKEEYLGRIIFDSVNELVNKSVLVEITSLPNKNITEEINKIKEQYFDTNEETKFAHGEVVRYINGDMGIKYIRCPYQGPELPEECEADAKCESYTEKIYIGTNIEPDIEPFMITHNYYSDNNTFISSNINGTSFRHENDDYVYTEICNVFGEIHITKFNKTTGEVQKRNMRNSSKSNIRELPNNSKKGKRLIVFSDIPKFFIYLKSEKEMEEKYGFDFSGIYDGQICRAIKGETEVIADFEVDNINRSVKFVFYSFDKDGNKVIATFETDRHKGYKFEQKKEASSIVDIKASISQINREEYLYQDNYQSFIINNKNFKNFKSDIFDEDIDNIYIRGIFGIPFLYRKPYKTTTVK